MGANTAQLRDSARRQVALVEGSLPRHSQETLDLLAIRLRTVALLLGAGFAVFLVRGLFSFEEFTQGAFASVFYAHLAVTLLLAMLAWRLYVKCEKIHKRLRFAELLIFGAPAAFFLLLGYHKLIFCAEMGDGHSHIPNLSGAWTLLIFCYAMFVPNT
jgi:hypothetical protein